MDKSRLGIMYQDASSLKAEVSRARNRDRSHCGFLVSNFHPIIELRWFGMSFAILIVRSLDLAFRRRCCSCNKHISSVMQHTAYRFALSEICFSHRRSPLISKDFGNALIAQRRCVIPRLGRRVVLFRIKIKKRDVHAYMTKRCLDEGDNVGLYSTLLVEVEKAGQE